MLGMEEVWDGYHIWSDVWCDIATLRHDGPKKNTSPQNISNEKQKQITNAKHKNKESDNQEPTFPPPKKKKHNKKDLKKKRSKLQP